MHDANGGASGMPVVSVHDLSVGLGSAEKMLDDYSAWFAAVPLSLMSGSSVSAAPSSSARALNRISPRLGVWQWRRRPCTQNRKRARTH